jgi:hypothetical protein
MLVNNVTILYILWPFRIFPPFWYVVQKNLATLIAAAPDDGTAVAEARYKSHIR